MSPSINCPNCGETLDAKAIFCSRCGKTVHAAPTQPSYPPAGGPTPYQQQPNQGFAPQPGYYPPGMYPPKSNNRTTVILLVLGLGGLILVVGAVLAFLLFNRAVPSGPETGPVVVTESPVLVETAVPPTEPPAPPTEPELVPDVNYEGISFMLGKGVASGVTTETIPAVAASNDLPYWEIGPQQWSIKLNGYLLNNTFHDPQILVYPIDEYIAIDSNVKERIDRLKTILAGQPADIKGGIPFLPAWNAGEVFHSNIKYLTFQNGTGIRYLSNYAQAVTAVNNNALFYSFQGITSDGKYYVSAVLPVRHPSLRENSDMTQQEYDDLSKNYDAYLSQQIMMLNGQTDQSFSPGLDLLDQMMMSIKIEK